MDTEQTLRRRIRTVDELRAIVRTMKALAAVSSRQSEAVLTALDDYSRTVEMGLQVALRGRPLGKTAWHKPPERPAAVIFGSDVGLCGRFNEDLAAFTLDKLKEWDVPPAERNILAVGGRIESKLLECGQPVEQILPAPSSPAGIGEAVRQILLKLDEWQNRNINRVWLFYSPVGTPALRPLLPVEPVQFDELSRLPWPSRVLPTFSLDAERLLAALIRQHLFVCLYRACAESLAAENQLRLRSMQAAEKNIANKLDELIFEFRSRRQDAIDAELLDIGAGFEAVNGL